MASDEVFEVVVGRNAFLRISDRCACCGADAVMRDVVNAKKQPITWFIVGHCAACQGALARERGGPLRVAIGLSLLAAALSLALALIPDAALPVPWFALPAAAALLGGAIALALRSRPAPAPRSARAHAVRITENAATHVTIECAHRGFAEALAWLNNGRLTARPARARRGGALLAVAASVAVGAFSGLGAWNNHYPKLAVDNLFVDEIIVWVDGEDRLHVPPGDDPKDMPSFRVAKGAHEFGFSPLGEGAPIATIRGRVDGRGRHLYNPGQTACYFRDVTVYGTTTVASVPLERWGPLDRRELYANVEADFYFEDPPNSIDTQGSTSHLYRVALYRDATCTELALAGCSEDILRQQIACNAAAIRALDVAAAVRTCAEQAVESCRPVLDARSPAPAQGPTDSPPEGSEPR
jgi:hypothetical protein